MASGPPAQVRKPGGSRQLEEEMLVDTGRVSTAERPEPGQKERQCPLLRSASLLRTFSVPAEVGEAADWEASPRISPRRPWVGGQTEKMNHLAFMGDAAFHQVKHLHLHLITKIHGNGRRNQPFPLCCLATASFSFPFPRGPLHWVGAGGKIITWSA